MSDHDEALAALERIEKALSIDLHNRVRGYRKELQTIRHALEQRRVPENESLESVANRVCRDIPDDCEISLCMEWGAGFVTLTKAGRYVNLPDAAEKSLVEQINDALAAARNPEQEDKDDE